MRITVKLSDARDGYAHNLTEKKEPLVLYLKFRDLLNRIDSAHGERVKIGLRVGDRRTQIELILRQRFESSSISNR